jgi:hypothetical protein
MICCYAILTVLDDDSNITRPTYTRIFFIGGMMRWPLHVVIARIAFDSYPSNQNTTTKFLTKANIFYLVEISPSTSP